MAKEKEAPAYNTMISDAARHGEYSNFVKIQHSGVDFRLDFAKVVQDENAVYVHTRVFMSPIHAKMFVKALQDNIEKYEKQFGKIELKFEKGVPLAGNSSHEVH